MNYAEYKREKNRIAQEKYRNSEKGKELFNSDTKRKRKAHSAFSEGEKVVFADLKQGDYREFSEEELKKILEKYRKYCCNYVETIVY